MVTHESFLPSVEWSRAAVGAAMACVALTGVKVFSDVIDMRCESQAYSTTAGMPTIPEGLCSANENIRTRIADATDISGLIPKPRPLFESYSNS